VTSLLLHLAVLLAVVLYIPSEEKQGKSGEGIGQRAGSKETFQDILPKVIEVEMVEPPEPQEDEATIEKLKKEKVEGLTECQDDRWYGGVGIQQDFLTDTVDEVAKGYPADKAGLRIGDVIKSVDSQTGPEIRGEPGTIVRLMIFRPSTGEFLTLTMTRDKICLGGRK